MDILIEKIKMLFYFPVIIYLSFFASLSLRRSRQRVIAVTGSVGKSSMCELINKMLKNGKEPYVYAEHTNSALGIPIYILGLKAPEGTGKFANIVSWLKILAAAPVACIKEVVHAKNKGGYLLIEVDSDRPGEVQKSGSLLLPQIVIWLNTAVTHSSYHDQYVKKKNIPTVLDSIAMDFSQSILHMQKKGLAILNCDDSLIEKYKKRAMGNVFEIHANSAAIRFMHYETKGLTSIFDYKINKDVIKKELWMYTLDDTVFASWNEDIHIEVQNYLLPEYYSYTFAFAIILAFYLQMPFGSFMKSVSEYELPAGRMSIFEGVHNSFIIDSTYNSSSKALIGAIDLLAQFEQTIAILGDMRELGNESKEEHELVAAELIRQKINKVFLIGGNMYAAAYEYLIAHGFPERNITRYETTSELKKDFVLKKFSQIDNGAVVLVKGSQNHIYMESVVELLLKDKNKIAYLCRRGRTWDERRINAGL